jgi:hypothetical protein
MKGDMPMNDFMKMFPRVTLVIFGMMIPILTGVTIIVFSVDIEAPASGTISPLPTWVVTHTKEFAVACICCAILAVSASLAMIKEKRWGHTLWIYLVVVVLVWIAVCLSSLFHSILLDPGEAGGSGFSFEAVAGLAMLVPIVGMLIFGIYLLRMLVLSRS